MSELDLLRAVADAARRLLDRADRDAARGGLDLAEIWPRETRALSDALWALERRAGGPGTPGSPGATDRPLEPAGAPQGPAPAVIEPLLIPGVPGFEGATRRRLALGDPTAAERDARVALHRSLRAIARAWEAGRPSSDGLRAELAAALAAAVEVVA